MMTGFTNGQIVSLLENHSLWSKKACREILARKDEFVPLLLGVLDRVINEKDPYKWPDSDSMVPVSMLLAQMRVSEAYPRLVSLFCYDDGQLDFIWNDWLFEIGPSLLRDTYNGNSALLPALIENRSVSPWSRMMAVDAYGTHYEDGYISGEEIAAFLRRLAYDVYSGKTSDDDRVVLAGICSCVINNQLAELIDDVKALYARNDIDKSLYGDFESWLGFFKNPRSPEKFCHVDVIGDLDKRGWFKEKDEDNGGGAYENEKIGRNDPCPCGSGKKYKHCHGR